MTLEHVGRRIELVYTPVRDDGLRGKPFSIVSDVIAPGKGNVAITCTSVWPFQQEFPCIYSLIISIYIIKIFQNKMYTLDS